MRRFLFIIGGLLIVLGFVLINQEKGYFNIPFFNVPSGYVRADFINQSPETIQSIRTIGLTTAGIIDLKPYTQEHILVKHNGGEGSCAFSIYFESGKTLSSPETYIESGYHLTYTIYQDSIHIDY